MSCLFRFPRLFCLLIVRTFSQNGSWLQEDVEGIFNKRCVIDYPSEFQSPESSDWLVLDVWGTIFALLCGDEI